MTYTLKNSNACFTVFIIGHFWCRYIPTLLHWSSNPNTQVTILSSTDISQIQYYSYMISNWFKLKWLDGEVNHKDVSLFMLVLFREAIPDWSNCFSLGERKETTGIIQLTSKWQEHPLQQDFWKLQNLQFEGDASFVSLMAQGEETQLMQLVFS
jgi:hypothetical protein